MPAQKAISFTLDTTTHPADFAKRNMGVWSHPVSGGKHIVLSDYGASEDVLKEYRKAQIKHMQSSRNYGW